MKNILYATIVFASFFAINRTNAQVCNAATGGTLSEPTNCTGTWSTVLLGPGETRNITTVSGTVYEFQYTAPGSGASSYTGNLCINSIGQTSIHTYTAASTNVVAGVQGTATLPGVSWAGWGNSSYSATLSYRRKQVTAASAGSSQYKCGSLAVVLTGNTPSVGVGTWTQAAGTGTSVFTLTNANSPGATATVSTYGAKTYRWTVPANGGCAGSTSDVIHYFQEAASISTASPQYICGSLTGPAITGVAPSTSTAVLWSQVAGSGSTTFNPNNTTAALTSETATTYGSKTYRWLTTNGTCSSSADIAVNYQETANAGTTQYVCASNATALAGNSLSTGVGTWTQVVGTGTVFSNTNANTPTATATSPTYGSKTYRWTANNTSCSSSSDVVVNFQEQATVGASPQNVPCNGTTSSSLGGNTPSVFTAKQWSQVGGPGIVLAWTPNNTTESATATVSQYGTYTFRWTTTNTSCSSTSDIVVVYSQDFTITNPTGTTGSGANASDPVLMCDNIANYTWSVSPAVTVTWSNTGTGSINSGSGVYSTSNISTPTQYADATITASTPDGTCTKTKYARVSNLAGATAYSPSLCEGSTNVLTSDVNGISWVVTGNPGCLPNCSYTSPPASNTYSFSAPFLTSGSSAIYNFTVNNGVCSQSGYSFTVYNGPETDLPANSTGQCEGTTVTYNETNGVNINWTFASGSPLTQNNSANVAYTAPTIGTNAQYQDVAVTLKNGDCTVNTNLRVYNQNSITSYPTAVCESNSATTNAIDGDVLGVTWTLSALPSGLAGSVVTANLSNTDNADLTPGLIASTSQQNAQYLVVNAKNGACTNQSVNIQVDNLPNLTGFTANPEETCEDVAVSVTSDLSVTWSSSNTGVATVSPASGTSTTITPVLMSGTTPLSQTATIYATNGECQVSNGIKPYNKPEFTVAPASACDNTSPDFDVHLGDGNVTWSSVPAGVDASGVLTYNVAAPSKQQSVVVTAGNGSCTPSVSVVMYNQPAFTAPFAPGSMCESSTFDFSNSLTDANVVYSIDVTFGTLSAGSIDGSGNLSGLNVPLPNANAKIKIRAANADEVTCYAQSAEIRIDNQNSISTSSPQQICETQTLNVTGDVNGVGWDPVAFISASGTDATFGPYPVADPTAQEAVLVTATNGQCTPVSITVNVDNSPTTALAGPDQVRCGFLTATLAGNSPTVGSGLWTSVGGNPGTTTFTPGGATSSQYNAGTSVSVAGSYDYDWTISNGVCPSSTNQVNIKYADAINLTAYVDDCMATSPSDKYYVYVSATGGVSPLVFSGTPFRNISSTIKIYEEDQGASQTYTVSDNYGCSVNSAILTMPSGHPLDIAFNSTTGNETVDCYVQNHNKWTTFRNSSNEAIFSVNDNNQDLGIVSGTVWEENTEPDIIQGQSNNCWGTHYLAMTRHFVINTSNAFASVVGVRLYYSSGDLASLDAATAANDVSGDQCTHNDNTNGASTLFVTKYGGGAPNENGNYDDNDPTPAYYMVFGPSNAYGTTDGSIATSGYATLFTGGASQGVLEFSVPSFSEFWIHGSRHAAPLPVTMIYFTAQAMDNSYIKLLWATSLEINNDGFQIERSVDGINWTYIGWVDGYDNSTVQHDYIFNDYNVTPKVIYYYRLKQMDNDGQFEYTDIVSAMINADVTFDVKNFIPNPTTGSTTLIVSASKDQKVTIEFFDVLGQKVKSSTYNLSSGANAIDFNMADFAAGTYTGVVFSENEYYSKKLVITR